MNNSCNRSVGLSFRRRTIASFNPVFVYLTQKATLNSQNHLIFKRININLEKHSINFSTLFPNLMKYTHAGKPETSILNPPPSTSLTPQPAEDTSIPSISNI
jgi:hypothetical protein